ncbi:RibD family protein [Marinobacter psychrophilus]|uniref:RibD family protein n=1 Tax=Marinobacter psychrophilus TaxID=330734 RepID=UPI001B4B2998|nr:RibD family protein [Marinobacter psychrophilus]MBQ0844045.1 RibD family protein [Marinobacter psychrophilus]
MAMDRLAIESPLLDTHSAWQLILQARDCANIILSVPNSTEPALALSEDDGNWRLLRPANEQAQRLFDLFLPLVSPLADGQTTSVIGQLGQSLDGRIATVSGHSRFINGDDGIVHLHRIRALSDAVVVGAGTAVTDNPQLTVRRTSGDNPVRVVIDRRRRVPASHHLFTDKAAPTLRLVAGDYQPGPKPKLQGLTSVLEVPCLGHDQQPVCPAQILAVLADFGLHKIFIEGGGVTVSAFLHAQLLDRLHVMVAPMIIGSGRPAFTLPEIDQLDDALRPRATMVNLGSDMLFALEFNVNHGDL